MTAGAIAEGSPHEVLPFALKPVAEDAIDFLRHWEPDGPWSLTAIQPDVPGQIETRTFRPDAAEKATRWIETHQGDGRNIYYSVNRPKPSAFRKKATKEKIDEIVALHVDIDLVGARNEEEEKLILRRLSEHPSPPTVIIFSGGGYQALWRLNEALKASEDRNIERIESLNKRRIEELGGDRACFNIDRIMRLPGTLNFPNEKKRAKGRVPALARVIRADWDRRITPALPAAGLDLTGAPVPDKVQLECHNLGELPEWLRTAIETGETEKSGGDRSRVVFAVTCELVRNGWQDDVIVAILLDPSNGISAHVRTQAKPRRYAQRQVDRARAAVNAESQGEAWFHEEGDWAGAPRELAEVIERDGAFTGDRRPDHFFDLCAWVRIRVGEKSWSSAARAYNRRYFRPPLSDKQAYDAIRRFNKTRGDSGVDALPDTIEVGRLQMIHGDPTCWRIVVNGTAIELDDITSQTEFRKKLARSKVIAPRMKARAFDTFVQKLLDDCEEIGGNPSATRAGLIKGHLVDFCSTSFDTRFQRGRDELLKGKPLVTEGRAWFRLKEFVEFLSGRRATFTLQKLQLTILDLGAKAEPTEVIKGALVDDLWSVAEVVVRGQTEPFDSIVIPTEEAF
jgi:hypothetical protein